MSTEPMSSDDDQLTPPSTDDLSPMPAEPEPVANSADCDMYAEPRQVFRDTYGTYWSRHPRPPDDWDEAFRAAIDVARAPLVAELAELRRRYAKSQEAVQEVLADRNQAKADAQAQHVRDLEAVASSLSERDQAVRLLVDARDQVAALGPVGRMYLDAIDADPEHELLTLPEAYLLTRVRDAVAKWEAERD